MERAKQRLAVGSVEQEGGGFGNHDPADEPAALLGIRSGGKAALQNFRGGVGAGARGAAAETELDQNGVFRRWAQPWSGARNAAA